MTSISKLINLDTFSIHKSLESKQKLCLFTIVGAAVISIIAIVYKFIKSKNNNIQIAKNKQSNIPIQKEISKGSEESSPSLGEKPITPEKTSAEKPIEHNSSLDKKSDTGKLEKPDEQLKKEQLTLLEKFKKDFDIVLPRIENEIKIIDTSLDKCERFISKFSAEVGEHNKKEKPDTDAAIEFLKKSRSKVMLMAECINLTSEQLEDLCKDLDSVAKKAKEVEDNGALDLIEGHIKSIETLKKTLGNCHLFIDIIRVATACGDMKEGKDFENIKIIVKEYNNIMSDRGGEPISELEQNIASMSILGSMKAMEKYAALKGIPADTGDEKLSELCETFMQGDVPNCNIQ